METSVPTAITFEGASIRHFHSISRIDCISDADACGLPLNDLNSSTAVLAVAACLACSRNGVM